MNSIEPILNPSMDRFLLHPIKYSKAYEMYKQQVACFWSVDEVDLAHDENDWKYLSFEEKKFILHVLAFFAASDGIVNENLAQNFSVEVQIPEIRQFYGFPVVLGPGFQGLEPRILGSGVWIPDSGVQGLDSGVSEGLRAWKSCEVGGFSPPLSVNSGVSEGLRVRESSEVGGFSPPLSV